MKPKAREKERDFDADKRGMLFDLERRDLCSCERAEAEEREEKKQKTKPGTLSARPFALSLSPFALSLDFRNSKMKNAFMILA